MMVSFEDVRKIALLLPDVVVQPHFEKTSFRVKKKIFATMDPKAKLVVVKLGQVDQSVFCDFNPDVIYPVKGAWGKQGWTNIDLKKVKKSILKDALITSYQMVSKGKSTKTKNN